MKRPIGAWRRNLNPYSWKQRGARQRRVRASALRLLDESQRKGEFLTGLLYVDARRKDFVTFQNMTETPLARLPDEALRPSENVLKKIMETI